MDHLQSGFQGSSTAAFRNTFGGARIFIKNAGINVDAERGATFGVELSSGDNSGIGISCEIRVPCAIGNDVMTRREGNDYAGDFRRQRLHYRCRRRCHEGRSR